MHPLLLLPLGLALLPTPALMAQTHEERREQIEKLARATPSPEAAERKARSEARLQQEGVPVLASLPVIEDSRQARARGVEEVAHRAIAICLAAAKAEGLEQATVDELVGRYGAGPFFSPAEAAFVAKPEPTQAERVAFSWRYEDYWVLLWALGYVDTLERPEGECDVKQAVRILRDHDTAAFIKDARLRPLPEILDQADLVYRYHWATTEARVKNRPAPAKLDDGVVMERHYVLNWLIGYMDQEWDAISTDT